MGIKHETIHAHTPEENGHIESYFGKFKEDYIFTREFVSFEDFRKYIEWTVSDYNTLRPHSSLNYMTPDEFESAILNEILGRNGSKKKLGGTNMLNYSSELKKLSEGVGPDQYPKRKLFSSF